MIKNRTDSNASKGGKARAKSLPPQRRKEIAKEGAAARLTQSNLVDSEKLLTVHPATKISTLHIGDIDLPCAVLADKTRIVTQTSVTKTLGRAMGGKQRKLARSSTVSGQRLPDFLYGSTLEPFVSESLRVALNNPVMFRGKGGVRRGFNASLIPEICDVWLRARDANALQASQEHIARNADILMRGLAHVGITALIDEATGYEKVRDRDELNKILEAYISQELLPWAKRFPDEFYQQLFRLRRWQYQPLSVKRPKYVGKLTNELIYEKLPPGVLSGLRERNPVTTKGYRKHKFFQFLTDDIGDPHLEKQITAVVTLMRVSSNWATFERLFKRAFSQQGEFDFPELEPKA